MAEGGRPDLGAWGSANLTTNERNFRTFFLCFTAFYMVWGGLGWARCVLHGFVTFYIVSLRFTWFGMVSVGLAAFYMVSRLLNSQFSQTAFF